MALWCERGFDYEGIYLDMRGGIHEQLCAIKLKNKLNSTRRGVCTILAHSYCCYT